MLTDDEYAAAMLRIGTLIDRNEGWGPPLDEPEGQELDRLIDAVVQYEDAHYSLMPPPEIAKVIIEKRDADSDHE